LPGSFSNNFTIDVTTGEMHSKEPLDREALEDERGQMVVTVEVYDHGVPQLSTSVNVTITVGVSPGHNWGHAGAGGVLEMGHKGREGMWDPWPWQGHCVPDSSWGREAEEGSCASCLWAGRCPRSRPQPAVGDLVSWSGYNHGL